MKYLFWVLTIGVVGVIVFHIQVGKMDLQRAILVVSGVETEMKEVVEVERGFSVLAFGDMMLGRYVRTLMDRHGMDYVFDNLDLADLRKDVEVMHANLEGPIFGKGRSGGTAMVFAFNRDVGGFLARHGFDVVSIANNHSLDMGQAGRDETMEVLREAGVGFCGDPGGPSREDVYFGSSETGMSYAFVCLESVTRKLNLEEANLLIEELDGEVDKVIVSIHWGNEYQHTANEKSQVNPAYGFVDSGADLVIGHHPHVVQNFEIYEGVPIFYSLGNFVFDQYWAKNVQEQLAIKVFFEEEEVRVKLIPMKSEMSQSRLMTEEEGLDWIERFIGYGEYDEEMKEMIRSFEIKL